MVGAVLPVHDAEHALFLDVLALAADGLGGFEADECFAVPEICGFSVLVPIFRVVMLAAELLGETIVVRAVHTGAGFLQEAVVDVCGARVMAAVECCADDELIVRHTGVVEQLDDVARIRIARIAAAGTEGAWWPA